ncbi:MAG: peroxidase family protein, partial [Rubripirellula sp.]
TSPTSNVTLDVFASGSEGGEQFEVLVDGQVVGEFSASTELERFSVEVNQAISPSSVRVQFTNDQYDPEKGIDRNLIVDKIVIDGIAHETESSGVFSTGTWKPEGIVAGFRSSDTLHTNGFFQFGLQSVSEVMSIDGTGNNLEHPEWGAAMEQFLRVADSAYADGLSTPSLSDNPNARDLSNLISDQNSSVENDRFLTSIWFQWGQFLDHDIARSFTLDRSVPSEDFEIADGFGFTRSVYDTTTGTDTPREQINHITAYIDGSVVYGSDESRSRELRELSGGRMDSIITEKGELLPLNTAGLENAAPPSPEFFVAGDVRANENVALTSMQTLWVREHNRVAAELAESEFAGQDLNDAAVDEAIFQRARQYVSGLIQNITYNEFLPSTLGFNAIPTYQGYDASINAQISNVFATAAYRMGHTTLPNELLIGSDGSTLSLAEAFSRPDFVKETGIEAIFEGLSLQKMQEVDALVVDGVRNALQDGNGGLDLVARNIQRGRDHGLPDFNSARVAIGLDPISSFYELTSNTELAEKLIEAYGTPDNADPWIAMVVEDQLPGASVGETINAYMVDQFTRLRDGDRFYFENVFDAATAGEIKATRLSDVIKRNTTGLDDIQSEVFWTRDTLVFRNGLDNEWLIRDFGENGGAEVVFFGVAGERDPNNRTETSPVQRDEPINAVVVAGTNELGDGFFIPNALVSAPKADLGVDEFVITADIEFFEGYGLGGDDRWVIESDIASVFASGDDGSDVLAVTTNAHDAEISLTGGNGADKVRLVASDAGSVLIDGGRGHDSIILFANRDASLTLDGNDYVALVTQGRSWYPQVKTWYASESLDVDRIDHHELTRDRSDWHYGYVWHASQWLTQQLNSEFTVGVGLPDAMDLRVFKAV